MILGIIHTHTLLSSSATGLCLASVLNLFPFCLRAISDDVSTRRLRFAYELKWCTFIEFMWRRKLHYIDQALENASCPLHFEFCSTWVSRSFQLFPDSFRGPFILSSSQTLMLLRLNECLTGRHSSASTTLSGFVSNTRVIVWADKISTINTAKLLQSLAWLQKCICDCCIVWVSIRPKPHGRNGSELDE